MFNRKGRKESKELIAKAAKGAKRLNRKGREGSKEIESQRPRRRQRIVFGGNVQDIFHRFDQGMRRNSNIHIINNLCSLCGLCDSIFFAAFAAFAIRSSLPPSRPLRFKLGKQFFLSFSGL
ncbi:MAG: hypothetical protein IPM66_19400 [Acidobacteriota bacterium]|nr:MAG: hypothetical protein IPM66_19400 [Acidobacteriota bacterium]